MLKVWHIDDFIYDVCSNGTYIVILKYHRIVEVRLYIIHVVLFIFTFPTDNCTILFQLCANVQVVT